MFIIPKEDKIVRFINDLREVNKRIVCKPYPDFKKSPSWPQKVKNTPKLYYLSSGDTMNDS